MGTHKLPKPVARPEQGLFPTLIDPITLLDFGSILTTLFFGPLEIQTDSSMAIQSGAPGASKTASGLSDVIGIRTPGVFTPGLGVCGGFGACVGLIACAGLGACVREERKISATIMCNRNIARILSNTLSGYFRFGHIICNPQIRLPCRGAAFELSPAFQRQRR